MVVGGIAIVVTSVARGDIEGFQNGTKRTDLGDEDDAVAGTQLTASGRPAGHHYLPGACLQNIMYPFCLFACQLVGC